MREADDGTSWRRSIYVLCIRPILSAFPPYTFCVPAIYFRHSELTSALYHTFCVSALYFLRFRSVLSTFPPYTFCVPAIYFRRFRPIVFSAFPTATRPDIYKPMA